MADLNINQIDGLRELLILQPLYSGNDAPGMGLNLIEVGTSRFWHKVSTNQLFLVYRLSESDYRLVELT